MCACGAPLDAGGEHVGGYGAFCGLSTVDAIGLARGIRLEVEVAPVRVSRAQLAAELQAEDAAIRESVRLALVPLSLAARAGVFTEDGGLRHGG